MQDNGMRTERKGTGRSALALVAIALLAVALVAVIAWVLMQPGVLETLAGIAAVVLVVIAIVVVIGYIAVGVIGIGLYATKGEVVQKGVSHSLDDIEAVDGNMSEEKKE